MEFDPTRQPPKLNQSLQRTIDFRKNIFEGRSDEGFIMKFALVDGEHREAAPGLPSESQACGRQDGCTAELILVESSERILLDTVRLAAQRPGLRSQKLLREQRVNPAQAALRSMIHAVISDSYHPTAFSDSLRRFGNLFSRWSLHLVVRLNPVTI
jgi:hypothetical protein